MSGYGVMDFMVRTYRNNKALLKKRKPLRKIYEENNLYYIKKKVQHHTRDFDPERKKIFLEKFYAKQKRIRKRNGILLAAIVTICSAILYFIITGIHQNLS